MKIGKFRHAELRAEPVGVARERERETLGSSDFFDVQYFSDGVFKCLDNTRIILQLFHQSIRKR